jgi:hypothetical protein
MLVVFRCKDRTFQITAVNILTHKHTAHVYTGNVTNSLLVFEKWGREWSRQFGFITRIEIKFVWQFFTKIPNIKFNPLNIKTNLISV